LALAKASRISSLSRREISPRQSRELKDRRKIFSL
jgi:hypothetical protein